MLSSSETSVQITNALEKLIDSGISLGERVLGALIIFIVGKFLVNWLNRLFKLPDCLRRPLHFQDRIMALRNIQELKRDTGEFHCVQV